jgi:hypothetical protein
VDRTLDRVDRLGSRARRETTETEEEIEEAAEDAAEKTAPVVDEAGQTTQDVAGSALDAAHSVAVLAPQAAAGIVPQLLRPFVIGADPAGWPIEKDVVVLLLDQKQLASVLSSGISVLSRRELRGLGRTLVTMRDASGPSAHAVSDLRRAHPGLTVDFNHVYRFAADPPPAPEAAAAAIADDERAAAVSAALHIGMIDSAVQSDHVSLRGSHVISADFAAHEGNRPLGHGTAVASLIARSAGDEAEIHAASAFFEMPGFAPGATTDSLIAALDWLVAQEVKVINMSLAGPPNALLEAALVGVAEAQSVVVAAVGNNGPSGEPLYPAAYEGVIGVTAVDRDHKVFRYANRGDHVDYAALGVNVKVADSGGSWRLESGTSMASPHVAVVIGRVLGSRNVAAGTVMSILTENAEDLGKKGFDRIFGYGLITESPLQLSQN